MKASLLGAGIAIVAVALAAIFLLRPTTGPEIASAEGQWRKPSENGLYSVQIAPDALPLRRGELHSWTLTLATADGKPVEDATITVEGDMPAHNHGLPTAPSASTHLGAGRYSIDGVRFSMTGHWVLRFAISAAAGSDEVAFDIEL